MEEEFGAPPLRIVNFVSEDQLDQAKKTRGEKVEDGTAHRDRPLYEILRENKEKKDAEFNERFKHRPPKALDEDETEFLENLDTSRKEYEQQVAFEEAEQLRSFHEAIAAKSSFVRELNEAPTVPRSEEHKPGTKKNQHARPTNIIISVKPQAKKAKTEVSCKISSETARPSNVRVEEKPQSALGGLVSYSDGSDDDDD